MQNYVIYKYHKSATMHATCVYMFPNIIINEVHIITCNCRNTRW